MLYPKSCYNEACYKEVQVYLFFLLLFQNIDCGYSLEPPRHVPTINVLSKPIKINQIFPMKFSIINAEKNLCTLHGHVFVMLCKMHIFFQLKMNFSVRN